MPRVSRAVGLHLREVRSPARRDLFRLLLEVLAQREEVMSEDESAPVGFHWEWFPAGAQWRLGGDGYKCRMKRCPNEAVAALARNHRSRRGFTWWRYCESHLYGRKIQNGAIVERRLVKDSETS